MRKLTLAERLIVGADYKPVGPDGREWVRTKVLKLADQISGTGVYMKVNSALRACGYGLIDEIHARGIKVFADLKLDDIKETLTIDGILLREAKPELLTVKCTAGIASMQALKNELPDTEILGVSVLTNLTEEDVMAMFICSREEAVMRLSAFGAAAKIDGFISSAKEVDILRSGFGLSMSINTPAIRPKWAIVPGDDQNKNLIVTPAEAIIAGADRIVVARPIILAENPYDAVMWTLEEIASVA